VLRLLHQGLVATVSSSTRAAACGGIESRPTVTRSGVAAIDSPPPSCGRPPNSPPPRPLPLRPPRPKNPPPPRNPPPLPPPRRPRGDCRGGPGGSPVRGGKAPPPRARARIAITPSTSSPQSTPRHGERWRVASTWCL